MNARDYALVQLDRLHLPGWAGNLVRRKVEAPTDPRDLGLAEQIRVGVIKNHALLNFIIDHYSDKPKQLDPLVRKILATGLYQLRFLTRIPPAAAVDETVEQTRRLGRRHAAGLVNAILRRAMREPEVPLPVLNDDPKRYTQVVLSHPADLVDRLFEILPPEQAIKFCQHDNIEPPTLVRLFKNSSPDQLTGDGITVAPHEQPGMFVVENARRATFADWSAKGIAQVQDATAAGVVERMDIQPGQNLLDRCAGLGTKTLQMQEFLGDGGWIMTVDPSEDRCSILRGLLATRRIGNVAVVQASVLKDVVDLKPPAFDRIVVDAPCSNSGVLARRPEARYAQNAKAIESLSKLQDQILDDTADYLRPGGLMIYSTCSVWPEENQLRVERFLKSRGDYELLDTRLVWPSFDASPAQYHDGGFYALFRRR